LLELTNEFSKVVGHKTNSKISCFPCSINEQSGKEMRKTAPFTTASKRTKYIGVKVTKKEMTYTPKTIKYC
jgi:hypothetical protein